MTDAGRLRGDRVLLGHGSGGRLYRDLVAEIFVAAFSNPTLERLDDAAILVSPGRLAVTTDSHVVQPLRFPGGDIGRLAVAGTVNDLATAAARPLALAAAFIIEEGLALDELRSICGTMRETADEAGVAIVTGDTKVVERGACDGVFITTTGVGEVVVEHDLGAAAVREGDHVLLSGSIGDHAVAILAARGEFDLRTDVVSDCAPLWGMVEGVVAALEEHTPGSAADAPALTDEPSASAAALRFLRDPTRGGLTTVLAELAEATGLGVEIREDAVPIAPGVRAVCDLLGYDPFALANEGKMLFVVAPEASERVLAAVRAHPYGRDAAVIGAVKTAHPGRVALRTPFGTRRVLDMPAGELLPRIC
jgi:hydrogenase expression/formation protein HypE